MFARTHDRGLCTAFVLFAASCQVGDDGANKDSFGSGAAAGDDRGADVGGTAGASTSGSSSGDSGTASSGEGTTAAITTSGVDSTGEGTGTAGGAEESSSSSGGDSTTTGGAVSFVAPCTAEMCLNTAAMGIWAQCSATFTIGREEALATSTFGGDTNGNTNSSKGVCAMESGTDQFFRTYLFAGDKLDITVTPDSAAHQVVVAFFDDDACTMGSCQTAASDGMPVSASHTASADGWVKYAVDGVDVAMNDFGKYDLDVTLTPSGSCECVRE